MKPTKIRYRVTNWSDYNQALIRRGDISLWLDETVIDQWQRPQPTGRAGRPWSYSDVAVQCMLALRLLYHLPLRAAQGLLLSLFTLLDCPLPVPDYSTLCRRQRHLAIPLNVQASDQPRHILIDSTGLKVFGEGEWKVRNYGAETRRTWRKLHLAVDADTREIVATVLTDKETADCEVLPQLLLKINGSIRKVYADGAYDTWECRYALTHYQAEAVIPPRENAVTKGNDLCPEVAQRDQAIRIVAQEGLAAWKQQSGYRRRSLAETTMFRVKKSLGEHLRARVIQNQIAEAVMKSRILNDFIHQGLPLSVKIKS